MEKNVAEFIQLRALGNSFDLISKKLDVSKPTLLKWAKTHSELLHNEKAYYVDLLKSKYVQEFERRIIFMFDLQKKIEEEMRTKDLSKENSSNLMNVYLKLSESIQASLSNQFVVPDDLSFLSFKFVNF